MGTKIIRPVVKQFAKAITTETGVQVHDSEMAHDWCKFRLESMNCDELIKFGEFVKFHFSEVGNFAHRLPKLHGSKFVISTKQLMLWWKK